MSFNNGHNPDVVFASLPRTIRGMPLALSASPNGDRLVYCNGNSVFIRSHQDITKCEIYTEHAHPTTVAKYAPSGFYVASGDNSGRVRIWDTTQSTHILKAEYPIISGAIRDIAWSDDSKRIAVVGEGRERFGHVFLFDTGTSNGNLSGQSRPMTSIDFRPTRPYRLISGSEDKTVAIFEGPPFKFLTLFHEHTGFVYCTRYNVAGTTFASASADGKVVLYEGTTGQKTGELVDESCKGVAHGGSIFGLCWSPDGQRIATASGDKTIKIWDVGTKKLVKTIVIGKAVDCQQLSVIWTKHFLVSVSLSGFINFLDADSGSVSSVLKGHNKPITSLTVCAEKSLAFTADFEGNITRWCLSTGQSERITPVLHSSQVSGMCITQEGELISVGWDDKISFTPSVFDSVVDVQPNTVKLSSQPRGIAIGTDGHLTAVACYKAILLFRDKQEIISENISCEASSISMHPDGKFIAVGNQAGKVIIYEISGNKLSEVKTLTQSGAVTAVAWSPNGSYLVATDANRRVVVYLKDEDYKRLTEKEWTFHTARVSCVAWSSDSRHVATGGIDTNVIVWDLKRNGEEPTVIRGAHAMSPINGIAWLDTKRLITAGQDSVIKIWTVVS